MPYRYAHHLIMLVLLPTVMLAFWPHYFGDLPHASFAFHAHGITATAWILLVAAQGWTVHARRFALHRATGQAVFVAVPLFAGGAAFALCGMAGKFVTRSDPFYAVLGPVLGMDDIISTMALVLMVRAALVHRRRAHLHGGYMLATVLLVLPPVFARLAWAVPPAWHAGEVIALGVSLLLALADRRQAQPFLVLMAIVTARAAADTWLGLSPAWVAAFSRLASLSPPVLALPAAAVAFLVLWSAWQPRWWNRRPRPAAQA